MRRVPIGLKRTIWGRLCFARQELIRDMQRDEEERREEEDGEVLGR